MCAEPVTRPNCLVRRRYGRVTAPLARVTARRRPLRLGADATAASAARRLLLSGREAVASAETGLLLLSLLGEHLLHLRVHHHVLVHAAVNARRLADGELGIFVHADALAEALVGEPARDARGGRRNRARRGSYARTC